jgi:hypothetical protein
MKTERLVCAGPHYFLKYNNLMNNIWQNNIKHSNTARHRVVSIPDTVLTTAIQSGIEWSVFQMQC